MRYRLCHRPRRGVLRAAEGQRPNRCRLCIPALDRHHVRTHGKGAARQDSAHHYGLRPLGVARRLGIPVELPAARHLLDSRRHSLAAHRKEGRRVRQAQGQEDRARLSRLALRQGADRAPAEARADARIRDHVPAGHASWCRAEGNLAADPPEPPRLCAAVGLGRDELDRHQGGGRRRLSAREDVRAEPDVRPAEAGAKGYNAAALQHTSGRFKVHEDLKKYLYDKGLGAAKWEETGEILYLRGLINAMLGVEAIRTAQERFGKKPLTGEQVRWGLENLDITADRIKQLGFEGELRPVKVSCADHEGARVGRIQTWDGKDWKITSDWYTSDDSVIAPMVKEAAAKYAAEKKIATGCLLTH